MSFVFSRTCAAVRSRVEASCNFLCVSVMCSSSFLEELAQKLFAGDINQAALRLMQDYRKGALGWMCLEWPPSDG